MISTLINNVGIIHIAAYAVLVVLCFITYRLGYGAAALRFRREIDSRDKSLAEAGGILFRREYELKQNESKLQTEVKLFEAERQRRIDEQVQERWDAKQRELLSEFERKREELREVLEMKRNELQSAFENKREELRGKYQSARDELQVALNEQIQKAHEKKVEAEFAEFQFKKEYEKWLARNREDEIESDVELSMGQMAAFGFIKQTKRNFFIQGKAGSGKSTLVQYLKEHIGRPFLLAAPTGAAARIIGGSTIHRLFHLPVGVFLHAGNFPKAGAATQDLLKAAMLLIIDEISMVRPDVLDAIDHIAREARQNNKPFGGLQVVLIGDLFQLPPVIKDNELGVFKTIYGYGNAYFFDARSYETGVFSRIELTVVHRQRDTELLKNLDNILRGENIDEAISYFNSAKIIDGDVYKKSMLITPTNKIAERINLARLMEIPSEERVYDGVRDGRFAKDDVPAPIKLRLKIGALVVFTNNSKGIINGTRGVITELANNTIKVRLLEDEREIGIDRDEWIDYEYTIDRHTGEIEQYESGRYRQFPLRLGYAMTIHKAQGMTLDNVIIDTKGGRFFASGQLYVALSRSRSKEGMHIERPLARADIIFDDRIQNFFNAF